MKVYRKWRPLFPSEMERWKGWCSGHLFCKRAPVWAFETLEKGDFIHQKLRVIASYLSCQKCKDRTIKIIEDRRIYAFQLWMERRTD